MTILEKAAETIQRLGSAAQDCKSCAKLPMCNAYKTENRFENCDYKWVHEEESADVQPVDRWISVDERLPKTGESVLVYVAINKNLKGFGECKPEIRIGWLDDGGKWALQFSNMDYSEVLCWMPLPEPPKDGDTNG